jgi:outer membrane biosynthesis protein TonB
MMQDSLARALGGLKGTRMDDVAAEEIRRRIQRAWTERAAERRGSRFAVPVFVRAFVVAALVTLVVLTTMRAGADSAFYEARVAVENTLVAFQSDPVEYLTQLYTERLEEAARFEATGNALAASRARNAQSDALRLLNQINPEPEQSPEPSASTVITLPSPSPTPDATASPTESPTPVPTATPRPTVVRTPTPKPATPSPTPTPKPTTTTTKPSPTPTPTPMTVHAYGYVLYADGTAVDGACVSTSLDGLCVAGSIKGRIDLQFTARKGQSITLYVRNYDASRGGTLHGKVTVTVGGPEVALGTITLR